MIGLVKPLAHIMAAAVIFGTAGYLCAIFLPVTAAKTLLLIGRGSKVKSLFFLMAGLAAARGILHYAEQYCNHYIAFRLLALIRHKVFAALRKLCPAKLDGRDKGNLISIITTDIELLEVFYAHTISPIMIAVLTCLTTCIYIGKIHPLSAAAALLAYIIVGAVIPIFNSRKGAGKGMEFRTSFGDLNSEILESLRGLDETIQYGRGTQRKERLKSRSEALGELQKNLNRMEAGQRAVTDLVILGSSFGMFFLNLKLYQNGQIGWESMILGTVTLMSSFGPVTALSNLSNNLNQTLASGERVLSLLEETPEVEEIPGEEKIAFKEGNFENVSFRYEEEEILADVNLTLPAGKVIGIHGKSGSGKSTLLKLLMRFYDPQEGRICLSGRDVTSIPTKTLRDLEAYVTQETQLFHDSIANNIAIGKKDATREEIIEAAKKASIHDWIVGLPEGYDTPVGELGDTLSGGEKQRIGIARAFLHGGPLLLLDEPTSNLDSLNEAIILHSLKQERKDKTIVLVSHRASTMNFADVMFDMNCGRIS